MALQNNRTTGKSKKEAQRQLQTDFTITPKTAGLLVQLGYHSYRDLRRVSPNHVAAQLNALPGMSKAQINGYRRALRRMVWLATQENPQEHAKVCSEWTNKSLKARGMWRDDFDGLTGDEVNELHLKATASG
jgi:hypothetical protein